MSRSNILNLSTLNLLERALQIESKTFHTLISSLSQEEALEVAYFLTSTKNNTPIPASEEVPDKILLVAENIKNIMNALDNFYVT